MEHDLEDLFIFAENNMLGFEVVDNDESKSFYLNEEFVGGYAGDRRDFFFENNGEFQFIKESYEARLRMESNKQKKEEEQRVNYIDIKIKVKDIEISNTVIREIQDIHTNKTIGYLDGPEDPVYDFSEGKNIQTLKCLIKEINNASDDLIEFPNNAVFRLEGQDFAVIGDNRSYEIAKDFPVELFDKYKGNKIFQTFIKPISNKESVDENDKFMTKYNFYNKQIPFLKHKNTVNNIVFDNQEEAKQAIIKKVKEDLSSTFDGNIVLFINDQKISLENKLKNKSAFKI
jgi:hypothetical protein